MNENKVKIVWLGDLHIGAIPTNLLKNELATIFLDTIKDIDFDILIQGGDFFDKKLSLESDDAKLGSWFTCELIRICKEKNALLRYIKGTASHDGTQHQNYKPLELEFNHFRIIERVQNEWVTINNTNYNILWLPEEYPITTTGYNEYYKYIFYKVDENGNAYDYNTDIYDMIFGHGEIDKVMPYGIDITSERPHNGTIPHSMDTLARLTKSICWFGHIHKEYFVEYPVDDNKTAIFGSSGSFSTWSHGEDYKKFNIIELSKRQNGYYDVEVSEVENNLARKFETMSMELFDDLSLDSVTLTNIIIDKANSLNACNGRLRLDLSKSIYGRSTTRISMLRELAAKYKNIDIKYPKTKPKCSISAFNDNTDIDEKNDPEIETEPECLTILRDSTLSKEERMLKYICYYTPEWSEYLNAEDIRRLTT